jgi:hypothetical protein
MMVAAMITSLTFAQKLQEKDVPASVKTAFQKNFPQAKVEKWEKEDDHFEVEFELNASEQSVLFDAQGNLLETEVEITIDQLPNNISDYIKANYKGHSVKEAAKMTDAKGTVTYEAEIKGRDLLFDSNGKFIKEVKD